MGDLATEVMAGLSDDDARDEVMDLVGPVRGDRPDAFPDVRDPGAIEEVREAFGPFYWLHYQPRDGAIEVRDVGWLH
ncbi:hypothetical protein [Streptomyces bathyalis]|nr:hypothetical protein [Streptomyces bathyalis]